MNYLLELLKKVVEMQENESLDDDEGYACQHCNQLDCLIPDIKAAIVKYEAML